MNKTWCLLFDKKLFDGKCSKSLEFLLQRLKPRKPSIDLLQGITVDIGNTGNSKRTATEISGKKKMERNIATSATIPLLEVVQAHVQGTRLVLIPRVPVQIITKELQKHGWNPMVEKESIVVPVPKVTKQQQQEMIKEWWVIGNKVKNSIRGYRQEARKAHGKEYDKEIQASTDGWITKIDSLIESKIKDL